MTFKNKIKELVKPLIKKDKIKVNNHNYFKYKDPVMHFMINHEEYTFSLDFKNKINMVYYDDGKIELLE